MQHSRLDRLLHVPTEPVDLAAVPRVVSRLAAVRPVALTVTEHRRDDPAGGLRRDRYTLAHEHRDGISAVVLTPDTPGEDRLWPAVLVCQGRNATLERVTGIDPPDYPDRPMAVHLANAGMVTLTIDYGLGDHSEILGLALAGRSPLSVLVEDALAAARWLAGLPGVDGDRIALFGHSVGAAVALHTALLLGRPIPLATASHLGSYRTLFGRLRSADDAAALPGIVRHADLPDLYGALAPAPLHVQYGERDGFLDAADAAAAGEVVRKHYAAAGAAANVQVLALPIGHGTGVADAAGFLGTALAAPTTGRLTVPAARVVVDGPSRLQILDRIDDALATGALTLGRYGARLEELAEPIVGAPAVAVSSGSAALEAALRTIGVQGRSVLVPVNTFFATAASAIRAGAAVDFVDMELGGLGMDPTSLSAALDAHPDVAAVVVVHIAGVVSPTLPEVLSLCEDRGVPVVEDAAHALGSVLHGRPAGSFGRLATFSLFATKVATSGEGGLVAAPSAADLDELRRYRDHGKVSTAVNLHASLGSNWRMSELHAAVGIAQLERLDAIIAERRRIAAHYDTRLDGLHRFHEPDGAGGNYYKYVVYLPDGVDRAVLKRRLRERHGVSLAGEVYDTLLCDQPYFAGRPAGYGTFDTARWFSRRHVCLPVFNGMTTRQQDAVVTALRSELA